jgi:2-succinyl-6-hydroxy-2,4-cyclohexadiene-1-carboxylate synthase
MAQPPATRRIVLAHGFTQTARSWDVVATLLRERLPTAEVSAVDMPGHGTAGDVRADLWQSADRLTDLGGHGTYVGYSMGARVALHAALAHPDHVERLVLIGATAGIDDDTERAERRRDDERLAERIEAIGVEAFIDEWLATPLFARLTVGNDQRGDRLRNTPHGLASSLRSTGTGTQAPLWDRLGEIDIPVLVLVGEEDSKFRPLGARFASRIRRCDVRIIAGAGHSVHLEAPVETVDVITEWLLDGGDPHVPRVHGRERSGQI